MGGETAQGSGDLSAALGAGLALTRTAWRDAWAPLGLSTAGWTALAASGVATLPPASAAAFAWTGAALLLLMAPCKLGALHRLAAGAEARDPPGAAGLQWTGTEVRLAATAVALTGLAGLAAAALAVGTAAASALPQLPRAAAHGALAAAALAALAAGGRLGVTLAADATEPQPRFARGWLLTRGAGAAPAAAVGLITTALPWAAALAGPALLEAGGARWPAWTLMGAAAAAAALTQFGLAPMNAGALAQLRRAGLARERAAQAVDTPGPLGDKAPGPDPAAPPPELLAT